MNRGEIIKSKMTISKAIKILRGFREKYCYLYTPLYYAIPFIIEYTRMQQQRLDKIKSEINQLNECEYDTSNLITCITNIENALNEVESE